MNKVERTIRMRSRVAILVSMVALAAVVLTGLHGSLAAPGVSSAAPRLAQGVTAVDVEVVLAVDVSYSMDPEEQALQREGYIAAITSREFMQALRQGMNAKVAMTYFEWAGTRHQEIIVPWRLIEGPESADAFAAEIAHAKYTRASRTSISGALLFAAPLFDGSGYRGLRRVVDVSGDGVNNDGPPVVLTRNDLLAKGITINGLPIMLKRPNPGMMDIANLDEYYEDCVIGGPGAFVIPIKQRDQFKQAIRTKLVQEIAGIAPRPRAIPASAANPRISCTIGERLWLERWGN